MTIFLKYALGNLREFSEDTSDHSDDDSPDSVDAGNSKSQEENASNQTNKAKSTKTLCMLNGEFIILLHYIQCYKLLYLKLYTK